MYRYNFTINSFHYRVTNSIMTMCVCMCCGGEELKVNQTQDLSLNQTQDLRQDLSLDQTLNLTLDQTQDLTQDLGP